MTEWQPIESGPVFTPDEVENLAFNQTSGFIHPFTCPNRGDGLHRDVFGDKGALVPTVRGWICPFCDYTQRWAHDRQKRIKIPNPMDAFLKIKSPHAPPAETSPETPAT